MSEDYDYIEQLIDTDPMELGRLLRALFYEYTDTNSFKTYNYLLAKLGEE